MIMYNANEQVLILTNCTTATELLEAKDTLEEIQPLVNAAHRLYNKLMDLFLTANEI